VGVLARLLLAAVIVLTGAAFAATIVFGCLPCRDLLRGGGPILLRLGQRRRHLGHATVTRRTTSCVVTARYSPSPGMHTPVVRVDVGGDVDHPLTAALEMGADGTGGPAGGHLELARGLGGMEAHGSQRPECGQHLAPRS
jgi:hypothetical protein